MQLSVIAMNRDGNDDNTWIYLYFCINKIRKITHTKHPLGMYGIKSPTYVTIKQLIAV